MSHPVNRPMRVLALEDRFDQLPVSYSLNEDLVGKRVLFDFMVFFLQGIQEFLSVIEDHGAEQVVRVGDDAVVQTHGGGAHGQAEKNAGTDHADGVDAGGFDRKDFIVGGQSSVDDAGSEQ